jgi:hypothetical protein
MGGVVAIRRAGGPIIELNYGRLDMPAEINRMIQNQLNHEFRGSNAMKQSGSSSTLSTSTTAASTSASSQSSSTTSVRLIRRPSYNKKVGRRGSPNMQFDVPVLPCPFAPFPDGAPTADGHIRNIFYRMGFNNKELVALCGAHTLVWTRASFQAQ